MLQMKCLCACIVEFNVTELIEQECQDGFVLIRSWTARDRCGNETTETQTITLVDEQGPEIIIMQPEISGITDGTIFEYTCNEGGIPAFYNNLNAGSILVPEPCGGTALTILIAIQMSP